MALREIFLSVSLLGYLPNGVTAQTLPQDVMQQINAASQIRVRLASGEREMLYAPTVDSGALSYTGSRILGHQGTPTPLTPPLQVSRITQIQVPHGSHALLGGKLGAA